ncbi:MAG: glycosyltransferase, partial [Myxococcota bacterium]
YRDKKGSNRILRPVQRHNTRVEDRKLYTPGSLQAWIAHWQDWSSCRAADFLIFDTHEHRDYFYTRYGLEQPSDVVPVGVPEMFQPQPPPPDPEEGAPVEVLFYGTYIPLQGIETILRGASKVTASARLTLIGRGQTYDAMQTLAGTLGLDDERVHFEDPVPFETLPGRLAASHISLGIFGTTAKALRVVPNKVVQAAAMGRPIITGDTPAIRRYFTHGETAWLVPPGDGEALAKAIDHLCAQPELLRTLGEGSRAVFEAHFSLEAITKTLIQAVERLEGVAEPHGSRRTA